MRPQICSATSPPSNATARPWCRTLLSIILQYPRYLGGTHQKDGVWEDTCRADARRVLETITKTSCFLILAIPSKARPLCPNPRVSEQHPASSSSAWRSCDNGRELGLDLLYLCHDLVKLFGVHLKADDLRVLRTKTAATWNPMGEFAPALGRRVCLWRRPNCARGFFRRQAGRATVQAAAHFPARTRAIRMGRPTEHARGRRADRREVARVGAGARTVGNCLSTFSSTMAAGLLSWRSGVHTEHEICCAARGDSGARASTRQEQSRGPPARMIHRRKQKNARDRRKAQAGLRPLQCAATWSAHPSATPWS